MVRRHPQRQILDDVRQEADGHPESRQEAHRQIDQVHDRRCRVRTGEEADGQAERAEDDRAADENAEQSEHFRDGQFHAAEPRAHDEEQHDDDRAEDHGHGHLGDKVRADRHRRGALHLDPSLSALGGDGHAEAKERRADHAERAVGGDEVLRHLHAAADAAAEQDAEEDVENNREQQRRQRVLRQPERLQEFVLGFEQVDAQRAVHDRFLSSPFR
jgi:hypothetical protein